MKCTRHNLQNGAILISGLTLSLGTALAQPDATVSPLGGGRPAELEPPVSLVRSLDDLRIAPKPTLTASAAPLYLLPVTLVANPKVGDNKPADAPKEGSKRILGIIPNYRTFASLKDYQPLTTAEKFKIAQDDTLDRGNYAMALGFAGLGQLTRSTPAFGQGVRGYGKYLGSAFADFAIGNYMTEAIYPSLLHQDPRYFRKGTGNGFARLGYAVKQIFWTHTDKGGTQFNFSEVAGNATAVAIANVYYPDNRNAMSAASKLGVAIALDTTGNLLKEFWPDLTEKLARRKHAAEAR